MQQKKLFQIVNKYLDYFFFIFTCSSLKKTINNIKDKTFCFPILEWTFFCKKKKKSRFFRLHFQNLFYFIFLIKIFRIIRKYNMS